MQNIIMGIFKKIFNQLIFFKIKVLLYISRIERYNPSKDNGKIIRLINA